MSRIVPEPTQSCPTPDSDLNWSPQQIQEFRVSDQVPLPKSNGSPFLTS